MAYPMGEAKLPPLRVDFDWRLKLEFHGGDIASDGGRFPYRELDHALGLTKLGGEILSETRRGKKSLAHVVCPPSFARAPGHRRICGRRGGHRRTLDFFPRAIKIKMPPAAPSSRRGEFA